ncbi:MAG: DEAD/DEAH box helicase family protein [Anaerolineaceae bacterium]
MIDQTINLAALEPLYGPSEEPNRHRLPPKSADQPVIIQNGRRPSGITIANNLRHYLDEWRKNFYFDASDTTRELLNHWFLNDHTLTSPSGEPQQFSYYFCQREAIETLAFLMEHNIRSLSALTGEYGGDNAAFSAEGVTTDEDLWPRYAFRMATGSGKTKVMSLAIVWSYFHALRESDSPMAKNFVVIAPNLTVFERLKQDFGDGRIFDTDPLIPPAWRGDWNLSVVLQDEASGAATGGTLYLTNIHRLYEARTRRQGEAETYGWMGPAVARARALDTGEALRKRITSHPNLMVINDEAHHLWDPDSAWVEAMNFLNDSYKARNGFGINAQLDFSATPKDKDGNLFKHIVCDSPLGEAVDSGIVKVPIIGYVGKLQERADENAAYRYDEHLRLGFTRWQKSNEEWEKGGKKALLFVMCENTEAADQITQRLNTDPTFKELNGKTINLHTNLKGKLKKLKRGGQDVFEFVENEKEISDEDLRQLRQLSRELDANTSPYRCIVSVLMLREGWDVRNVTTIIPLRPYNATAGILPEQTLGRGLRRMTPPGQALETVTVVEHPAFLRLYRDELVQEGFPITETSVDQVPRTTMSIFPDPAKDWDKLKIGIPSLTDEFRIVSKVEEITFDEVKQASKDLKKLELGNPRDVELEFEGRALITNEVVERMKITLPLLQDGMGAIAFYRQELETICRVKGTHRALAPLIEKYLTEELFTQHVSLFDPRLVARLGDQDVREYIRFSFVPLINRKSKVEQQRLPVGAEQLLSEWKPFQVTYSEKHPLVRAERSLFNFVSCDRSLEVSFATFADLAEDVAAFAKNTGPQALRIDYEGSNNRHAYYTPDFFVRLNSGKYYLVETKGEMEQEVGAKAKAAKMWCQSASQNGLSWEYLFVPEGVFSRFNDISMQRLADACTPELSRLLQDAGRLQAALPFYEISEAEKQNNRQLFIKDEDFEALPADYQKKINQATDLFNFLTEKNQSYSPCFQPLMSSIDHASVNVILALLKPDVPAEKSAQDRYFMPDTSFLPQRDIDWLKRNAVGLKKALVYSSYTMPISMLSFCLEYARLDPPLNVEGIFASVKERFGRYNESQLFDRVERIRIFRNNQIAHSTNEDTIDAEMAKVELKNWITGLVAIHKVRSNL